jgi:hypothetical protein
MIINRTAILNCGIADILATALVSSDLLKMLITYHIPKSIVKSTVKYVKDCLTLKVKSLL